MQWSHDMESFLHYCPIVRRIHQSPWAPLTKVQYCCLFVVRLNKLLNKQTVIWDTKTPLSHCNVLNICYIPELHAIYSHFLHYSFPKKSAICVSNNLWFCKSLHLKIHILSQYGYSMGIYAIMARLSFRMPLFITPFERVSLTHIYKCRLWKYRTEIGIWSMQSLF